MPGNRPVVTPEASPALPENSPEMLVHAQRKGGPVRAALAPDGTAWDAACRRFPGHRVNVSVVRRDLISVLV